jgi:hypothetical protein
MQKLITSYDRPHFEREVNDLMEQGAKTVPGTLTCALSSSAATAGYDTAFHAEHRHEERWAVVLELPQTLPKP